MGNIICIILIVVWAVCLIGMVYSAIQAGKSLKRLKRNDAVWFYRTRLIQRCSPDIKLVEKIINKHSYEDMLNSCKPLEDKYWFTPEEIEEINSNHISHLIKAHIESEKESAE